MIKKIFTMVLLTFLLVQAFALPSFAENEIVISFDGAYSDNTLPGTMLCIICSENLEEAGIVKYYLNGAETQVVSAPDRFFVESVPGKNEIQVKVFSDIDSENPIMVSNLLTEEFANFEKVKTIVENDFTYDGTNVYDKSRFFNLEFTTDEIENVNDALKITATERRTIGLPGTNDSSDGTLKSAMEKGGYMYLSYDFKTDMVGRKRLLYVDTEKENQESYINGPFLESNGSLTGLPSSYEKIRSVNFSENEWHNIKIVVDVAELIYDVYIDNIQIVTKGVMDENSGVPGYVYIAQNWDRVQSEYYLDNVELSHLAKSYTITPHTESNGETTQGLSEFPLSGASAKFVFSEPLSSMIQDNVHFTVDGKGADFEFSFDTDENAAIITPLMEFSGREKCLVSFDNVRTTLGAGSFGERSFEFFISPPNYGIASVSLESFVSGAQGEVAAEINNNTSDSKSGSVVACIYKDSKLIKASSQSFSLAPDTRETYTLSISVPEDYNEEDFECIVYLMDKETFFAVDSLVAAQ